MLQLSWDPSSAHASIQFSSFNLMQDLFDGTEQERLFLSPLISTSSLISWSSFADISKHRQSFVA
jgi:hypothetical protein